MFISELTGPRWELGCWLLIYGELSSGFGWIVFAFMSDNGYYYCDTDNDVFVVYKVFEAITLFWQIGESEYR
jgi:hypothetical protein